ncbi:retrovirus-related pol polyprotein from transposon TNT 1-94 [Tanacetum coccineum]
MLASSHYRNVSKQTTRWASAQEAKFVTKQRFAYKRVKQMSSMQEEHPSVPFRYTTPMLDRTDFESWQQRYVYVITRELREPIQQGPVLLESLTTFSLKKKERYKADNRANQYPTSRLKESNCDQLYAYLKQHEVHANENRIMMERFCQPNNDPLALFLHKNLIKDYPTHCPPHITTNHIFLKQTIKPRAASKCKDKAMVQTGKCGFKMPRGRYNANNQGRPFKKQCLEKCVARKRHIARECPRPKQLQDSDYFKDKMLLNASPRSGGILEEELHCFLQENRYKELVGEYEKRAKFELTDRERKIDEQMRIIISDRNRKEMSLKSKLHSAQILLSSTVDHYKSKTEEVTLLKKDFKQKEDKFLEEFLDIKKLKDKIEDRLYKQDQSVQTVHMLCKLKSFYDEKHKVAIGYKNPLCLARAKQTQSALYNGYVLVTTNHTPRVIHDSEDTLELAEITRNKMQLKMQSPLLYPPNTPVKLVPRILPTKSQVKINLYVLTQLFTEFDKTCKTRITPTGITEGERGFEQTKRCYLTEVIPFFKTLKEHFVGVQTALCKEVKEMKEIFDQMNNEVDKNTVDKQCAEIEKKNLLIENENLIVNCLSTQLLYDVEKSRCLDLEADMSKVHDESKLISKLEREYLNLQLKYQHLQESFDNKNSQASQEAPDFNSFFKIKNLEHQIQEKDNVIRNLKVLVANAKDVTALIEQNDCVRIELEKVKQHYKELYDSIKIARAHTSEKTSTMLNEIESLKAQLRSKEPCFTSDYVKPKVLAPGMYAIDVKPIPHPLKNNRSAHLNYISHLKENVETVREIVEEARVVKLLDNSLNYACQYTKLSQELIEYVIGTCPKNFNERDNKAPSTPVSRKKQFTFSDKPGTSSNNTQKHKLHQRVQQTNIPVIPSTGVNDSTEASGSKPRSNTKKRILPAKKENKKEVEVRLRTNKSVWTKVNRVDSSISSKRVVINSNSESVCKTCNKCVNSASHGMCVVNILNSVNATSTVKTVLNKGKQIWKPKGRLSDNSLYKTKRVWKATGKLFADIGYQWRPTGKKLTLGKLDCGSQWRPTGKKFALGEMCHLTKLSVKCCSKHMTGNRSKLMNFVEKFIGSVRFGNDHLGAIMGYGDYVMGDSVISRVYYVEGLGHNLFSVGQFCDSDLEVAFRKHTCFVRDIKGTDILKGSRGTNLYTISIDEMMKSSPICLLSKASKSKSWLWHRRLNHLNFGTINDLARKDLVRGLPRLKFEKDHLCSACQLGKSKKFSHRPKSENTNMEVLHTLHMDLCGPMRVQSIKGKKYILVIVDDYSRFTWVKFLRSKDETPEFVTNFLKQIQVGLNKTVRFIRTDNGTEFVNQVMSEYYEGVGIFHQKSVPRTPQQNGVVERRNRTLVEAARTMMIFSKAPMFLWAEAVATACYTQNRSLIHTRHNKTPYELVHDKKPDLTFFRVFGALCYPTNDSENLGKFQAKADIGIFVGYAPSRKGYRIYNKRTRRLMETIHVTFDEMHQSMAPVRISSGPEPVIVTPGQLKSGLAPTDKELEMLFQPMFDEHLEQSRVDEPVPYATEINAQVVPPGTSLSTTIAQDAPSTSASSSTSDIHLPVQHQEIAEEPIQEDTPIIHDVLHPSHNLVTGDPGSAQSSSGNVNAAEPNQVNYPPDHLRRWTKDHPLDNIVGNPSRPVSTRKHISIHALWCCFYTELSKVDTKNSKWSRCKDRGHQKNSIANAATKNMIIYQMDVKIAFLNGDLQEEVFAKAGTKGDGNDTRSKFSFCANNFFNALWDPTFYITQIKLMQMRSKRMSRFKKKTSEVLSFLEIDWIAWSSKKQRSTAILTTKAKYIVMSKCFALVSVKQRPALSSLNTSTYGTIHPRAMEIKWLNSLLRERIISLQTFTPKHTKRTNTMAEQNVPNHPPTRTDEQIVPRSQWLTIGKSNLLFNAQKIQKNPIFQISVDILKDGGLIVVKLMRRQWFDLSADLLRKALAITPVIPAQPFELPPSGNTVIDFVNELGLLACDKPNTHVLQKPVGKSSLKLYVDQARAVCEEILKGSNIFSHKASLKKPKEETHVPDRIPSKRKGTTDQLSLLDRVQTSSSTRQLDWTLTSQPEDDTSEKVTSGVSIPVSDPEQAHEALAGPDPEPMKEDQTGSDSGKLHVSLAGPNPEHMDDEFLATAYPKVHENLKLITDERVIDDKPESQSGSMSSMKNLDDTFNFGDQFLYDKPTEDDQEKSKVREESDSTIPDTSHQTVTSTPPVIAPFTDVSSTQPSSLVTPPPINTEATTITTSLPEITPFIALQLRVARLEQEMSEVKKTDHSADVLASIKSQVPTAVDKYLGTKLDDALLKILERHTADLIEKYSVLPGPESVKNQESEKSPKEIIRAKKEQDEEKQDSTYSIRSTDKVDLEEFDLKSALFNHMNKKKSANRNTANYHLYHALMEALIADEDAMDKEVADKVKDHKRKHDSDDDEDDDDDEGPSAGSNQGRSTKKRRSDSAASGSAKPPPKDDDQSSKKPRETEASASKQHPALTSTGWQITDTREAGVDSSMHRSDPESEHSEQSSDDISMQDEGNDSDMEDTDNAHIPKVSTTTWFKPIPEGERSATPEPEWTIPPNDFPEPENNWANTYATTYKVPAENKLQRKTYDIGSFIKWFCRRTGKKKLCKADLEGPAFNLVKAFHKNSVFLQYQMDECHKLLTNKVDLSNPEGHQILRNIYEPLPLGGPPGQITSNMTSVRSMASLTGGLGERNSTSTNTVSPLIVKQSDRRCEFSVSRAKDFKNLHPNDFEDLFLLNIQEKLNHLPKTDKTSLHTAVNMWIRNLVIRNRVGDLQLGIESYQTKINLERPNWDAADYLLKKITRLSLSQEPLSTETEMIKENFHLFEYNKGMETRKWSEDDKRRSKDFITAIEKRLQIRRIYRSLESFVGGRIRDIDYRLINRTTQLTSLRFTKTKRTIESRAKRSSINLVRTQHPSETMVFHNEDGNPARANIKQALGYLKDGDGNSQLLRYQTCLNHVVCLCARYLAKPTERHFQAVKRIFRYLNGTINLGLMFLGDKLVSWSSKKQKSTAISSIEAEYIALSRCYSQSIGSFHSLLTDYGFQFNKIPLYYCVTKCLDFLLMLPDNVQHSRAKHIDIRYHFIKEQVENGIVELYFVRTEYQLADIFTKPLPRERFNFLIEKLGMRSMSPETLNRLAEETDE